MAVGKYLAGHLRLGEFIKEPVPYRRVHLEGVFEADQLGVEPRVRGEPFVYKLRREDGVGLLEGVASGQVVVLASVDDDADEGLFLRYDEVEFKAPVYAGDYIEARGRIVKTGNTSQGIEFEAWKVIAVRSDVSPSAADYLDEPLPVTRARGVCVTPKELQRAKK